MLLKQKETKEDLKDEKLLGKLSEDYDELKLLDDVLSAVHNDDELN